MASEIKFFQKITKKVADIFAKSKISTTFAPAIRKQPLQKACEADMKKKLKSCCKKFLKNLAD